MQSLDLKEVLIHYLLKTGLNKAALLIKEICGGEISKIDIQKIETHKSKIVKFDTNLFEKISGFKISTKEMIKILEDLGFKCKKEKKYLKLMFRHGDLIYHKK